jgi:hypothetical protein
MDSIGGNFDARNPEGEGWTAAHVQSMTDCYSTPQGKSRRVSATGQSTAGLVRVATKATLSLPAGISPGRRHIY